MAVKSLVALIMISWLAFAGLGGCKGEKANPGSAAGLSETKGAQGEAASEGQEGTVPGYQGNTPPRILRAEITPDPASAQTDLTVEVEAEDADADLITYTYQWLKAREGESVSQGSEMEGETGPTLSHENFTRGDALAVRITPRDGRSENGQTYRTKYVVVANSAPEITSSPPEAVPDQSVYRYQVKASDADGDPITFSLGEGVPKGMAIDSASGLITWPITPKQVGTYEIIIHGDDGHNGTCSQHYTLTLGSKLLKLEAK